MKLTILKATNLFDSTTQEIFCAATGKFIRSIRKGEGIEQTLFDLPEPEKKPLPEKETIVINPNQKSLF